MEAANQLMQSLGGDPFTWAMYWSCRENATNNANAYVARLNKIVDSNYKKINGNDGANNYRARAVKKITIN